MEDFKTICGTFPDHYRALQAERLARDTVPLILSFFLFPSPLILCSYLMSLPLAGEEHAWRITKWISTGV
jgi:hypothetical protein